MSRNARFIGVLRRVRHRPSAMRVPVRHGGGSARSSSRSTAPKDVGILLPAPAGKQGDHGAHATAWH